MAIGLRSVIKNLKSPLALKALSFGALMVAARFLLLGGWGGAFVFGAGVLVMYFNPPFRSVRLFASALILTAISVLAIVASGAMVFWLSVFLLSFLFYLVLIVKDLTVLNRDQWYFILQLALIYAALSAFFFWYGDFPGLASVLLVLVMFLLSNERFPGLPVISGVMSFLALQAVIALGLLPLGFINAAVSGLLIVFFFGDLIYFSVKNKLSARLLLVDTTTVTLGLVATFFLTRWVP